MNEDTAPFLADLSTDAGRGRLPMQAKPYWVTLEPGIHLGFYKGARAATWYARRFLGARKYKQVRLGRAAGPSSGPAGGLGFEQAAQQARDWYAAQVGATSVDAEAIDVDAAPAPAADKRLQPRRLDRISAAWRPPGAGTGVWLPGFFLSIEYAHYKHDKRVAEISKAVGVNPGDLLVLLAMRRLGPANAMRPTDLFRELLVTSGAITKRIDRLVAAGLIERVASSSDRRSEPVKLTRNGTAVAERAMARIDKSLAALVKASGLTDAELRGIEEGFRRLIAHM